MEEEQIARSLYRAAGKGDLKALPHLFYLLEEHVPYYRNKPWWDDVLRCAVKYENDELLQKILEHGINYNAPTKRDGVLHIAAFWNKTEACQILLRAGANPNIVNQKGLTALLIALTQGHFRLAECALVEATNVNIKGEDGDAALHIAAAQNKEPLCIKLIKYGADVNLPRADGNTALHIAAENNNESLFGTLIKSGANVNLQGAYGNTALHLAISRHHVGLALEIIKNDKLDVNIQNITGAQVLTFAIELGNVEILTALLEKGVRLNHRSKIVLDRNSEGRSYIRELIEKYYAQDKEAADKAARDNREEPEDSLEGMFQELSLRSAAASAPQDVQQAPQDDSNLLQDHNHLISESDFTPLMEACLRGNYESVSLLLNLYPTALNEQNQMGDSALICACNRGRENEPESTGRDVDYNKVVALLLSKGAEVNVKNIHDDTPLMFAAAEGDKDVVQMLLKHKAEVNVVNKDGVTPLLHACFKGRKDKDIVQMLLEHKAEVNVVNKARETPLMYACVDGSKYIVQLLLEHGAVVNVKNIHDETPLMFAAFAGDKNIVQILLEHNADTNVADKDGDTALDYAKQGGNNEIVKLIEEYKSRNRGAAVDAPRKIQILQRPKEEGASQGKAELNRFKIEKPTPPAKSLFSMGNYTNEEKNRWRFKRLISRAKNMPSIEEVEEAVEDNIQVSLSRISERNPDATNDRRDNAAAAEETEKPIIKADKKAKETRVISKEEELFIAYSKGHHREVDSLLKQGIGFNFQNAAGRTVLMEACFSGDDTMVKKLFSSARSTKANFSLEDKDGKTVFSIAKERRSKDIIEYLIKHADWLEKKGIGHVVKGENKELERLLQQGVDPNTKDKDSQTYLMWACVRGEHESMKVLFNYGASVTEKDKYGNTAFLKACHEGHEKAAKLLLERYPEVINDKNNLGESPLMKAALKDVGVGVIKLLLGKVDINYQSSNGASALINACKNISDKAEENVALLLDHGADINALDQHGKSIVMYACMRRNPKLAELLLDRGAKIDLQDSRGESALMFACMDGNYEVVELLLKRGVNVDLVDQDGQTAFIKACKEGHLNIAELLLVEEKIDLQDERGQTALMRACKNGHSAVVSMLLSKGADISLEDKNGHTAKDFAGMNKDKNKGIQKLILDHQEEQKKKNVVSSKAAAVEEVENLVMPTTPNHEEEAIVDRSALHKALQEQDDDLAISLIESDWDNACKLDSLWATALHHAASYGRTEVVMYFIETEKGADLKDGYGATVLDVAYRFYHDELVTKLIKFLGPNACVKDADRFSVLHKAAKLGDIEQVLYLVERGIDINLRNEAGDTALIVALWCNKDELVKELIGVENIDVNIAHDKGVNALHLAAAQGKSDIASLLLKRGAQINARDIRGHTALHTALQCGHDELAKKLIEVEDIDVNIANIGGGEAHDNVKAIDFAVQFKKIEIIKLLLAKGAIVDDRLKEFLQERKEEYKEVLEVVERGELEYKEKLNPPKERKAASDNPVKEPVTLNNKQRKEEERKQERERKREAKQEAERAKKEAREKKKVDKAKEAEDKKAADAEQAAKDLEALHTRQQEASEKKKIKQKEKEEERQKQARLKAEEGQKESDLKTVINRALKDVELEKKTISTLHEEIRDGKDVTSIPEEIFREFVNKKGKNGNTALHCFLGVIGEHPDIELKYVQKILKYYVRVEADPTIENNFGMVAGDLLSQYRKDILLLHAFDWSPENLKIWLDLGANVNAVGDNGTTVMLKASAQGKDDLISLMLDYGADVNYIGARKLSPLMPASCFGHIKVVELLLKKGANIDELNIDGQTPLIIACTENHEDIALLLLEHNANPDFKDNHGKTALDYAKEKGLTKIVELLQEPEAALAPQQRESKDNVIEDSRQAAEDSTPNNQDENASLSKAEKNKRRKERAKKSKEKERELKEITEAFHDIIKEGGNLSLFRFSKSSEIVHRKDIDGNTAFHHAANMLFRKCVESDFNSEEGKDKVYKHAITLHIFLLNYKEEIEAELDVANNAAETPFDLARNSKIKDKVLELAVKNGLGRVRDFVLKAGADINLCDENGYTLLFNACFNGITDRVAELLKAGANVDIQGNAKSHDGRIQQGKGFTALMAACMKGEVEIIEMLLDAGANRDIVSLDGKKAIDHCTNEETQNLISNHDIPVQTGISQPPPGTGGGGASEAETGRDVMAFLSGLNSTPLRR